MKGPMNPLGTGAVAIFGDWHGNIQWMRIALRSAAARGIALAIHVGDLKMLYPDDGPFEQWCPNIATEIDREAERLGITFIFVDGNHDNHEALRSLPKDADGFARYSSHLWYATRGSRAVIGGRKFGFLGGAYSISASMLTPGIDWWPEESICPTDVECLGDEPLDVLISHEAPAGADVTKVFNLPVAIEQQAHQSRLRLLDAVKATRPSLVFSGHWHQRRTLPLQGLDTTVEVLDMEGKPGNMVLLDLGTLNVSPLLPDLSMA